LLALFAFCQFEKKHLKMGEQKTSLASVVVLGWSVQYKSENSKSNLIGVFANVVYFSWNIYYSGALKKHTFTGHTVHSRWWRTR
jgi:hypothetical protein